MLAKKEVLANWSEEAGVDDAQENILEGVAFGVGFEEQVGVFMGNNGMGGRQDISGGVAVCKKR